MTRFSPAPTTGLATRKPDAANPPKTIVQNAAAPIASKVNDSMIVHLMAKYSLGNRMPSEAELTGSGWVMGWILGVERGSKLPPHQPEFDESELAPTPVIASEAKQSRLAFLAGMDCFAALAMTLPEPGLVLQKNPPEKSPADR